MTNQLWTAALFTDLVQTERGWMVRDGTGTVAEKAVRPVLCRLLCCQHRLWMWEHWPSLSREKEPDPGFLLCLSSQAFIDLFERDSIILSDNAHPSVKLPFLEADMGKSKDLMFHESIRRKRERESKPGAAGAERESWNGSWGLSVWRCHHSGWLESWARSLNSSRRSSALKWIFKIKAFFFFFFLKFCTMVRWQTAVPRLAHWGQLEDTWVGKMRLAVWRLSVLPLCEDVRFCKTLFFFIVKEYYKWQ